MSIFVWHLNILVKCQGDYYLGTKGGVFFIWIIAKSKFMVFILNLFWGLEGVQDF